MTQSNPQQRLRVGAHFIDLAEYPSEAIADLVRLAQHLEQKPEPRALAGKILGLLFLNPSLRTLASMQAAMFRLGGQAFVITPGQGSWGLESRPHVRMDGAAAEHIREGLPVLAGYCDALGIRAFAHGEDLHADVSDAAFLAMAKLIPAQPVINLESAINHPCQALADWKTLEDLQVPRHSKFVLSWVPHPKPLPLAVPAAVLTMAAQRGHEVVIARPEGFALPEPIMAKARQLAERAGGSVRECADPMTAYADAHIIYAKEWGTTSAYGDAEHYRECVATLSHWQITEQSFSHSLPPARLLHCLPVRRNVAVDDRVLDGPRSSVIAQAHNRLWAQMAVLHRVLGQRFT
jgi:N-acetylornithine carbamoyltransferase